MIIKDFIFNNKKLSEFGYALVSFSESLDDIKMGSHVTFNTVKSSRNNIMRTTSVTFDEVLTTQFDIAKYNCETGVVSYLKLEDIREIMNWLNIHENKRLIFLDLEDGYDDVFYLGSFLTIDKIVKNSQTLGLRISFTSCLPYALSMDELLDYEIQANSSIYLVNDNDCKGYLIPDSFEILIKEDGNLLIENLTTKLTTEIKNCHKDEKIVINGDTLWIDTNFNEHDICNDFNYNFIKLLKNDETNKNVLQFSLSCSVHIKVNYIRKVGIV